MTVKFQVVGIFYSDEIAYDQIKPTKPGEPHLVDVMNAFKAKTKNAPDLANFDFTRDSENIFVIRLAIDHRKPFKGRTGIHYDPGLYQLSQDLTPGKNNAYTVWQYYLFDSQGKAMPVSGEAPITETKIPDGYKIIWRLVEICNGPSPAPKRLYRLAPFEAALAKN